MPRDGFPSSIVNPVVLLEVLPSSRVGDVRKDVSMEGIRDLPMIRFLFVVASTLLCSRSLLPEICNSIDLAYRNKNLAVAPKADQKMQAWKWNSVM